ncbi:MAG TPA: hypothetical protein VJH23_05940 [archaeon]|nr:hypothetical protein [archaeon]
MPLMKHFAKQIRGEPTKSIVHPSAVKGAELANEYNFVNAEPIPPQFAKKFDSWLLTSRLVEAGKQAQEKRREMAVGLLMLAEAAVAAKEKKVANATHGQFSAPVEVRNQHYKEFLESVWKRVPPKIKQELHKMHGLE